MHRILAAIMAFACLVSLTACSGTESDAETTVATTTTTADPIYTTAGTSGVLSDRKETSTAAQDSPMEITAQMAKVFEHGEVDVEEAEMPEAESASSSGQVHHTGDGKTITISCIGDTMAHDTTFEAAWNGKTYDFDYMMEELAGFVEDSDFMIANLETTLAGEDRGYTGYPDFNTPEQIADSLRNVLGVDLCSTANNHSNDRGYKGICKTLENLDARGIYHVGTNATEEDSTKPLVVEIEGVKFGFINYTYGLNNIDGVKYDWSINVINKEKISAMCKACTEAGAEYIIALMHWGVEYDRSTSADQRSLAEWIFANTDVRLIIGHHPHVVQPIDEITVERNGQTKKGIVLYSLGNFTGSMSKEYTDTGLLATITLNLTAENENTSAVESIVCRPTYVDSTPAGDHQYRVISIGKALEDSKTGADKRLSSDDCARISNYMEYYQKMLTTLDCVTVE